MVHAQALQIDGLACKKAPGVAPGLKSLGRLIGGPSGPPGHPTLVLPAAARQTVKTAA